MVVGREKKQFLKKRMNILLGYHPGNSVQSKARAVVKLATREKSNHAPQFSKPSRKVSNSNN